MIRTMFALCFLLAAGCGVGEVSNPPPPRGDTPGPISRPPVDLPPRSDSCYGSVRHGPISVDLENIDEVRSLRRLCDEVDSFSSFSLPSLTLDNYGPGKMCRRLDFDCVDVYRNGVVVGTLDGGRFEDIFSSSFGPFRLDDNSRFSFACFNAHYVELRCF